MKIPLGWKQLWHKPWRLAVALLGIAFAVLLIMVQLGFRSALIESAVRFQERFDYDIALFSPDSVFIVRPESFSIRRLYQAMGDPEVVNVEPIYIFPAIWKNPWNNTRRSLNAVGFDPGEGVLDTPGFDEVRPRVKQSDTIVFDARSRAEFGPVVERFQAGERIRTEVNDREVEVVGLFEMGTSFGIDGTLMTSVDNWLRLFPDRERNEIQLGLVKLAQGADPDVVRNRLEESLPADVLVMTKQDFVQRETAYWNRSTPVGYIFAFGAIMGLVVGAIIVYQILFADVSEHLDEYGTLRAIGYGNGFIAGVVLQQSTCLAVLGFMPGLAASWFLYGRAAAATSLPLYVSLERGVLVFVLTFGMCVVAGLLAVRKAALIDPAEVF